MASWDADLGPRFPSFWFKVSLLYMSACVGATVWLIRRYGL